MTRDNSNYLNKIITIPNILSFFRILLIPFIIWSYCFKSNYTASLVVILISAITDVVDGFIARKFNMISNFGKIFDPLADKLTQITIISCLITRYKIMLVVLLLLICKDLIVSIFSYIVMKKKNIVTGAKWYGRVCTILLFFMFTFHIAWINIPELISCTMIFASTICIITTGTLYVIMDVRILNNKTFI